MSEPLSSKKTEEPRYKVGDIVNLSRWDASERPSMHMGDCVVLKVYASPSESGWVLNVKSLQGGSTLSGMDQNWFRFCRTQNGDKE
jgi:hypothetical protein